MNRKSFLPLMEQLIMILVFALAAVLCLQSFSLSDRLSRRQVNQDRAVTAVQSAAETLKQVSGDFSEAAALMGGTADEDSWTLYFDENWQPTAQKTDLLLTAVRIESQTALLGTAQISLKDGADTLFTLTAAWQEER